jgi:hypothetical protein
MSPGQIKRSGPAGGRSTKTITTDYVNKETTARLAEDADQVLVDVCRVLEASDVALSAALLEDSHAELGAAGDHAVLCHARIRRLLSAALHIDFEAVA